MSEDKLRTALGVAMSVAILIKYKQKQKKPEKKTKKRRIWSIQRPENLTYLARNELRLEDPKSFKQFCRLSKESFDNILNLVGPLIAKQNTSLRETCSITTRLLITLRFLASADSFQELADGFGVSKSLVTMLVPEVLDAIHKVLSQKYFKSPTSAAEWKNIANEYYEKWNFPMCLGVIDGKHVALRLCKNDGTGTHNYNYKGFNSIILIAVVDANYNFIMVDVGINGKANNVTAFNASGIGNAIKENSLNFPEDEELPETNLKVPYVFVSDADFGLKQRIIKPYGQSQAEENNHFNYRLSKVWQVVENAFSILESRFKIFQSEISLSAQKVELITLACCALHNYLNMVEQEKDSWDKITNWTPLQKEQEQDNYPNEATDIRNRFKYFFNSVDFKI